MKKKIIALLLVVSMLAIALVSGTLAYFTDNGDTVNVFTIGNVNIDLDEEVMVYDLDNKELPNKVVNTKNGSNFTQIVPGNYMQKTVTIENTEATAAYVRVLVIVNNIDKINAAIEQWHLKDPTPSLQEKYNTVFDGWQIDADYKTISLNTALAVDTAYKTGGAVTDASVSFKNAINAAGTTYDYANVLNNNEICYAYYFEMDEKNEVITLFDGLECPEVFGYNQATMFQNLKIEIYADAIQAEGFDNEFEAIAALDAAHPMASLRALLPEASVEDMNIYENTELDWKSISGFPALPADQYLESVYKFTAPDDSITVLDNPYKDWITDYYVSLDRDLEPNQIILGGNYGTFGWIGFSNGDLELPANNPIPLLGSVTSNGWTYEMVVDNVGEFLCGVADIDDALSGATFTVELRITNPNDASDYYVIESVSYTFN